MKKSIIVLGSAILLAGCATWKAGREVENAVIRVMPDKSLACVITNVPCLVNTNGNVSLPHFTDSQWRAVVQILTANTNRIWAVQDRTITLHLKPKPAATKPEDPQP